MVLPSSPLHWITQKQTITWISCLGHLLLLYPSIPSFSCVHFTNWSDWRLNYVMLTPLFQVKVWVKGTCEVTTKSSLGALPPPLFTHWPFHPLSLPVLGLILLRWGNRSLLRVKFQEMSERQLTRILLFKLLSRLLLISGHSGSFYCHVCTLAQGPLGNGPLPDE